MKGKNSIQAFLSLQWFILLIIAIFLITPHSIDPCNDGKRYWSLVFSLFFVSNIFFVFAVKRENPVGVFFSYCSEISIIVLCAIQSVYGLYSLYTNDYKWVMLTGSFDNVAGFSSCIVLAIPFCLKFLLVGRKDVKIMALTALVFCTIGVVTSQSRTGMLCLALCVFVYAPRRYRLPVCFFILLCFLVLTFFLKTESTTGRFFILLRSLDMIKAKPFLGWGPGGFSHNYMQIQADYFECNQDSHYAFYAGNIHHPLNEFVNVFVNYGYVGITILLFAIAYVVCYCNSKKNSIDKCYIAVCLVIACYALFSYPFHYPFTLCVLMYTLYQIFKRSIQVFFIRQRSSLIIISLLVLMLALVTFHLNRPQSLIPKTKLKQLVETNEIVEFGETKDYRLLYYYARELYEMGYYSVAKDFAEKCLYYYCDYELQLLRGAISESLCDSEDAVRQYEKAHFMCPNRITPLFCMFEIYKGSNDTLNIRRIRGLTRDVVVKVPSTELQEMISAINSEE